MSATAAPATMTRADLIREIAEAREEYEHAERVASEHIRYMMHWPDRETEMVMNEKIRDMNSAKGYLDRLEARLANWKDGDA